MAMGSSPLYTPQWRAGTPVGLMGGRSAQPSMRGAVGDPRAGGDRSMGEARGAVADNREEGEAGRAGSSDAAVDPAGETGCLADRWGIKNQKARHWPQFPTDHCRIDWTESINQVKGTRTLSPTMSSSVGLHRNFTARRHNQNIDHQPTSSSRQETRRHVCPSATMDSEGNHTPLSVWTLGTAGSESAVSASYCGEEKNTPSGGIGNPPEPLTQVESTQGECIQFIDAAKPSGQAPFHQPQGGMP